MEEFESESLLEGRRSWTERSNLVGEHQLDEVPKRLKFLNDAFTEMERFNACESDISLGLRSRHLETELVLARCHEILSVLHLSVGEQDRVTACKLLAIGSSHSHIKCRV